MVATRVVPSYVMSSVPPACVVCSVSWSIANGSPGWVSDTSALRVTVRFRPEGVFVTTWAAIGARMPQRGSGPDVAVVTVPSAPVIVVTPSAPKSVCVTAPDGSVTVVWVPPAASVAVSYCVMRPAADVLVTRKPSGLAVRAYVVSWSARSLSETSRPAPS